MNSPPRHTLLIVGGGEVATALRSIAPALSWDPTVVDSLEEAERIVATLGPADSVLVLSHHVGVDAAALAAALSSEAGYIGAMGSRITQARRRDAMLANGVTEDLVDSIRGPAGLDIGADTPGEIAVSMLAEIIAVHRGVSGGSLSARPGPIHPDLPPGTAECPAE